MRVCVDIQSAVGARAGVGRYTMFLVQHLGLERGPNEVAAFHFDFRRRGPPFAAEGVQMRRAVGIPGRLPQFAWKTTGWPPFDWFAGSADVYHFPNFIIPPLSRGAGVVTIHDLAFLRHPETIESKNLAYLRRHIRETVRRADAIIAVSEFTAREIVELLGASPDVVHPIHSGLDPAMRPAPPEAIRSLCARLNLDRPYLLSVGTLEPRKNFTFLVEIFERLTSFDGVLAIAGRRGWKFEPILSRINQSIRRDRIRLLETLHESDLPALYSGAELFILPSLYEGFGFPPLEAMACHTPAVVSTGGALAEVCADGALVIDGYDPNEWAFRIARLLDSTTEREELRRRGIARAAQFSWRETARRTWAAYEASLARHESNAPPKSKRTTSSEQLSFKP
ncbi:MAG: glycosyltransferase family 4 protein [Kiritimatiellae bacterium]|nr:glycosyltransferase family 4 protein [Kiritimatiellia bacterium]MDW8458005.1 glycosyltransferase family 1 protein [Verrucomicrobiota bacterium]